MNKAQLIEVIANDSGISKTEAKYALDSFINNATTALKKGERVSLVGFGTFSVTKRAARIGRNPKTGASVSIPARNVVKFKAGADLYDRLN